jgi:hypothetical protein
MGPGKSIVLAITALTIQASAGQESEIRSSDSETARHQPIEVPAKNCVNMARAKDIVALTDRHVYVRTIANNEYLLEMQRECRNLRRSSIRGTARFEPFGRETCSGDGSHFVYDDAGRVSICPVGAVQPVEDLRQAQEVARGVPPAVQTESVTLPE